MGEGGGGEGGRVEALSLLDQAHHVPDGRVALLWARSVPRTIASSCHGCLLSVTGRSLSLSFFRSLSLRLLLGFV